MASPTFQTSFPTPEEILHINSISNPVIRNLRITECYYRLSKILSAETASCANWCTFATWASRQAGRTIRGEDLLDKLGAAAANGQWTLLHPIRSLWRMLLRRGLFYPETMLGRLVREIHSPFDAFERASDAVARGNLKVFAEIGLEFARYLAECPRTATPDSREFLEFQERLGTGDPPEGQGYLRNAFRRYQFVRNEPGNAASAERVFLANLEIGLHEQTRLQPEIKEALEAGPATGEDLGERARRILFPVTHRLAASLRKMVAAVLGIPAGSFRTFVRDTVRRVVTESLMELSFAGTLVLSLGRNLEYPSPHISQTRH
jgi:hypothetical protein